MKTIIHLDCDKLYQTKLANLFKESLSHQKWQYISCHTVDELFSLNASYEVDFLIIGENKNQYDLKELITSIRLSGYSNFIILNSYYKDSNEILSLLKVGLNDYFLKNKKNVDIVDRITNLYHHNFQKETIFNNQNFAGITLQKLNTILRKVAHSQIHSILVLGETGTGKELVAQMLNDILDKNTPFYKINCANFNDGLITSELFGHEKGAYTGAHSSKEGLFSKADGGWLFLDEVAQLPLKAQSSLLRVLENGEFYPLGSTKVKKTNVKIISATNEPLDELILEKKFRQDLLERLRLYQISLPPLRQRSFKEIEEILNFHIDKINLDHRKLMKLNKTSVNFSLSAELKETLLSHSWDKGNIREMRNILRQLAINSNYGLSSFIHLPEYFFCVNKAHTSQKNYLKKNINFPISYEVLENRFFLEILNILSQSLSPQDITFKKLTENLSISKWKCTSQIDRLEKSKSLPSKYEHLLKKSYKKTAPRCTKDIR